MITNKITIGLTLLFIMVGCNSTNAGKVVRIDPREMRDSDANYGSEDLHIFIKSMIQSMLRSKVLNDSAPYMTLSEIKIGKGVDEHMDTKLIQNNIRTNLIKTTKVHFIDHEYKGKVEKNIDVDYILSGDIHAIKKDTSHTIGNFYVLSLKLTDSKTSVIVWTKEKEIRKVISK
jgi:PBP1b-binding outer membrane lipoprotein LpoB